MGCGSSAVQVDKEEEQNAQDQRKKGTQAAAADKKQETAAATEENAEGGKKRANTRARRLSYVSADANGVPAGPNGMKMPELGPDGDQGEGEEGEDNGTQAQEGQVMGGPGAADGDDGDKNPIKLSVACMSRAGREPGFKKTNQDNCFAFEKYITEDQSLFGAMDGHGPHGHLVSGYVKQHLPIILVNHLTTDRDVKKALHSGFVEVDKSLGNSRIDCEFSGSTAVVSYLKGTTLTTAWVGDSRGVLGREGKKGVEAVDLTYDHKPTNTEEKARILRSNGRVERLVDELGQPMGPHRVWLQYAWIPGLAMSRALGDVLAHQVGVSSEPDTTVMELTPADKFMVLASDGVWEFISSKEAVEIVDQFETAEEACRQLVDEAYQRWLTEEEGVVDDITAVVVKFIHQAQ